MSTGGRNTHVAYGNGTGEDWVDCNSTTCAPPDPDLPHSRAPSATDANIRPRLPQSSRPPAAHPVRGRVRRGRLPLPREQPRPVDGASCAAPCAEPAHAVLTPPNDPTIVQGDHEGYSLHADFLSGWPVRYLDQVFDQRAACRAQLAGESGSDAGNSSACDADLDDIDRAAAASCTQPPQDAFVRPPRLRSLYAHRRLTECASCTPLPDRQRGGRPAVPNHAAARLQRRLARWRSAAQLQGPGLRRRREGWPRYGRGTGA